MQVVPDQGIETGIARSRAISHGRNDNTARVGVEIEDMVIEMIGTVTTILLAIGTLGVIGPMETMSLAIGAIDQVKITHQVNTTHKIIIAVATIINVRQFHPQVGPCRQLIINIKASCH